MSRKAAEQAFEAEPGDKQRAEAASRGGKSFQGYHEQETEGDSSPRAQFRQFEPAAPQRAAG